MRNDLMLAFILDESFFCSKNSANAIQQYTEIMSVLPRMFPTEDIQEFLASAASSIEGTTQTLMTGQLMITILLSVSLKQLWNLLNVMQVLAVTREFTQWPATIEEIIKYLYEALYLE